MYKVKKLLCYTIAIYLFFSYSACLSSSEEEKLKALEPQALNLGDKFYSSLLTEDYDTILLMFSYKLFAMYDTVDLRTMFIDIKDKYGVVKEYEIINTTVETKIKDGDRKRILNNYYKVTYSSGFISKEKLIYEIKDDVDVINKIDAYTFNKYAE